MFSDHHCLGNVDVAAFEVTSPPGVLDPARLSLVGFLGQT